MTSLIRRHEYIACPQKGCHHGGNFDKSQPICKILPLEREGNLQFTNPRTVAYYFPSHLKYVATLPLASSNLGNPPNGGPKLCGHINDNLCWSIDKTHFFHRKYNRSRFRHASNGSLEYFSVHDSGWSMLVRTCIPQRRRTDSWSNYYWSSSSRKCIFVTDAS